jgi:lipopolysaccharide biosynthesis glycosyltransferase
VKKDPVNLICAANAAYNMPLCVMLSSVVDNFDPERELAIHIISNDSTEKCRENVRESLRMVRANLTHVKINWLAIDSAELDKLPTQEGQALTRDTFSRIFAPSLLPDECERAVYLDSDMVVLADISKLYDETAESGCLIHAVHDMGCPWVSFPGGVFDYEDRGIPGDTPYFNGGVLVINLKLWRERNMTPPMVAYLGQHGYRVQFADQGALNAFLHHDWKPLDFHWNQLPSILDVKNWLRAGYSRKEWRKARLDPFVIHYLGPKKPWVSGWRFGPRRVFFFRYLQKTVHRGTVPRYPYLEALMGVNAYYHLWSLGNKLFPQGIRLRQRPVVIKSPAIVSVLS